MLILHHKNMFLKSTVQHSPTTSNSIYLFLFYKSVSLYLKYWLIQMLERLEILSKQSQYANILTNKNLFMHTACYRKNK